MAISQYLLDTSAANRLKYDVVAQRVRPMLDRFLVATCAMLNLEALYSAQSPDDYEKIWNFRNTIFEYVDTDEPELQRAQEVQRSLAERSQHRIALPDLLIAAVAERHSLAILHYDKEFDLIASVTGQPVEYVVPPGTVP